MEPEINNLQTPKNPSLTIKDCLRLIGIKEITANIYEIPKTKKSNKEIVIA